MSSQEIPYVKASGCGNAFILVAQEHVPPENRSAVSIRLCGPEGPGEEPGADGVEWIGPSPTNDADVNAILINADGSEAEISGNGTRCVAAHWIITHGGDVGTIVRVRTGAGVKQCRLTARDAGDFEFETNHGEPVFEGELELSLPTGKIKGTKLSMGNPQFVVFVNEWDFDWKKRGAEIQAKKVFVHGVNVDFVRVLRSRDIEARFFERGVGATHSSGTGSCAAAVAAIAADLAVSPVRVRADGGPQVVTWEKDVFLRGPASVQEAGVFTL